MADSVADQATPGLVPLAFGGNGRLTGRRRTTLWETIGELRLFPAAGAGRSVTRHRVTLTGDLRLDGVHEEPGTDRVGTFTYPSLDALAAGRPAAYTRTLVAPERAAHAWSGFVAASDQFRVTDRLLLLYGARAEATRFTTPPARNGALEQALGVRTDVVPTVTGVSPRLGFSWIARGTGRADLRTGPMGTFTRSFNGVLRGGVGAFQQLLTPDLVAQAGSATGLPGATRQLRCVGDAVPAAAWAAWAGGQAPPDRCAGDTTSGLALADSAPSVWTLDPRFTAPRSWRGNLAWSAVRGPLAYSVEGIVSLNRHQPGVVDANFAGRPQFTLAGEGRSVFVPVTSIDPRSGTVSPVASRVASAFGRVAVQRSDRRSTSRQLTLTLAPAALTNVWHGAVAYTLGSVRAEQAGFDAAAFGDPRAREWARGALDVRHQVLVQGGATRGGVTATLFGRVESGRPFTPVVAADVNGDGVPNDRAFVFDPAAAERVGDAALAAGTRALLASAPGYAQRCLTRALGQPAARQACEGPWTAALNARVEVEGARLRLGRRAQVGLQLTNLLGGIDQLVHGAEARGWGGPALPDPVLYQVRGFDSDAPAGPRFRYAVNPRFGDARPRATALRSPFRATLDVRLALGAPLGEQQLVRFLRPGRQGPGTRLGVEELRQRYARTVPDPYAGILQLGDSLLLTRAQVEALEAARARHRERVDSLWTPLVTYLAGLGADYQAREAFARQEAVTDAVWEASRLDVWAVLPGVLSPAQQRALPWPARILLAAPTAVELRNFVR